MLWQASDGDWVLMPDGQTFLALDRSWPLQVHRGILRVTEVNGNVLVEMGAQRQPAVICPDWK